MPMLPFPVKAPLGGLVKNIHSTLLAPNVASDGRNVRFYLGGVEKCKGSQPFGPGALPATVLDLANYKRRNGVNQLLAFTKAHGYVWTGAEWSSITGATPFTGGDYTLFSHAVAEDIFIATNGLDAPRKYTGSGDMENLGGSPPVARIVRVFNGHTLLGGLADGPSAIAFSKWGQPEVWSGTGTGVFALADTPGFLQTIELLQRYAVAYKDDSIYLGSYLTAPLYFSFVRVADVGLLAPRAVTGIPKQGHLFVGIDNVYLFNGVFPEPIGNEIRNEMFSLMNPSRQDMTFCCTPNDEEAIVAFASTNSNTPDLAYTYNYQQKAWSPLQDFKVNCMAPYFAEADTTIDNLDVQIDQADFAFDDRMYLANAPLLLVGDALGNIRKLGGDSDCGADIDGWVQFGPCALELPEIGVVPEQFKRVLRLDVQTGNYGPHTLEVSVGYTDYPDQPMKWTAPKQLRMDGQGNPWVDVDVTARYFGVRFRTARADQPWRVQGFTWRFLPRGVR